MALKVVIYTTPTCTYCRAAKDFFRQNRIQYEEVDVSENEKARTKMIELSGQFGTPVITISEGERTDVVIGYDKPTLVKYLKLSRK